MSDSEIIYNFEDFFSVKIDSSVWNVVEPDKV